MSLQLRFPREYRLPLGIGRMELDRLDDALSELATRSAEGQAEVGREGSMQKELADLAVQLWRLGNRLIDPETREPTEETRIAYKRLEAAWDSLRSIGIEVRDYTSNEVADHGSTQMTILSEEPRPNLDTRTVVETVKPAIFFKGNQIGLAEVIVGYPKEVKA